MHLSFPPVALIIALTAQAPSQRQSSTYTYDVNGRRVEAGDIVSSAAAGSSVRTERSQSLNGRMVPLESAEESVLRDGPDGRVVERLIRRYDPTGRPGAPEKVRIEERRNLDGSSTTLTTTWQGDLNGRLQLAERTTTHARKSGDTEHSETTVERPSISGAVETVEKRTRVETGGTNVYNADLVTYRRNSSGSFYEAAREVSERKTLDRMSTETTSRYNATNSGHLELAGRQVSRTERLADGTERQVVDVYGAVSQGRTVNGFGGGPQLREQQIIERRPTAGGGEVETFSVRRPSLSDAGQLGPAQKISETVCTGHCTPQPAKAETPSVKQ